MLDGKITGKSGTFFMVPFRYDDPLVIPPSDIWQLRTKPLSQEGGRDWREDREVIFPHIMDTLQGYTYSEKRSEALRIYSLLPQESGYFRDQFWPSFCRKNTMKPKSKKEESIDFEMYCDDTLRAPQLFIYEQTHVGVLTFLVTSNCSTEQLVMLNYALHKTCGWESKCLCPGFVGNEEGRNKAQRLLGCKTTPEGELVWDMSMLIKLLLNGISAQLDDAGGERFTLFSGLRMHFLTYRIVDDSEEEKLDVDYCNRQVLYLSRCCKNSYKLSVDNAVADGTILHTFENIHIVSSIEGCAIMAVAQKENRGFIMDYDGQIRLRFFWAYLLAFMQRYVALNISRRLLNAENDKDEVLMWETLEEYRHVKARAYWTDISPYTQHGQFYKHCLQGLRVKELYDEIESKTSIIRLLNDHRLASIERRLGIAVALLTVAQVIGVVFTMSENSSWRWPLTIVLGLAMFVILFVVMKLGKKNR